MGIVAIIMTALFVFSKTKTEEMLLVENCGIICSKESISGFKSNHFTRLSDVESIFVNECTQCCSFISYLAITSKVSEEFIIPFNVIELPIQFIEETYREAYQFCTSGRHSNTHKKIN